MWATTETITPLWSKSNQVYKSIFFNWLKVLPSKIFELATYPKIILAGVSGYSSHFINNEVTNSFVFDPCDVSSLVYRENTLEIP